MYTDKSDKKWGIITAFIVGLMLFIAGRTFLGRDCSTCISGWETLKQEGPNFWGTAILGSVLAAVAGAAFFYFYKKIKEFKPVKPLLIALIAFIAIAWGKGCTDKANNAVTTEKGRIGGPAPIDTTRMSAEDIIKQQQK